ncbi:MAG: cytidylyltransferase domain-containing protein [Pseudomonadota bacterium]
MTSTMAFVFARGGSKGLPGKNIKPLCGKPLLAYSIEAARQCNGIDQVFVSTDDGDIANVAKHYNATVIKRPPELANDTSPEWLSWQHAIKWVQEHYGRFDTFVSVPATSPLTSSNDILRAIQQKHKTDADICLSVTPSTHHPSFNMVFFDAQRVQLMQPLPNSVTRRQDVSNAYNITTCVYVASTEHIMNNKGLFDGQVTAIEVPRERAVDIDDIMDFKFAELLMRERSEC